MLFLILSEAAVCVLDDVPEGVLANHCYNSFMASTILCSRRCQGTFGNHELADGLVESHMSF